MNITMRHGSECQIDEADLPLIEAYSWYELNGYAAALKNGKIIYMHRLINDTPAGLFTDHINRDKLDNRRANLRTVGNSLSQFNQNKRPNKSKVRGVDYHMGRWRASIGFERQQVYLGHYDTIEEASDARLEAEEQLYG